MYGKEKLKLHMKLPVQAVCFLLTYLFLSVNGHASLRQIARNMHVQQLDTPHAVKPSRKAASKREAVHKKLADQEQQFKVQIGESHVESFITKLYVDASVSVSALALGQHVSELVNTINNFHACLLKTLSKFLWHVHIVWLHLLNLLPAS